jgi:cytochrome c biogenesis protein CcmG/thiol:disulfide interchange protein DsbE
VKGLRSLVALGIALAACVALIFVLVKAFGRDPHAVPFMLKGKQAPGFTLNALNTGEAVSLDKLRGKPVVLNFWSTWCGPCRMEHPVLAWGFREYGTRAHFYGSIFEDTEENAREYLRQFRSPYPQLVDPQSRVAVDYAVAGVPETYFIDAAGVIQGKHVGPLDPETFSARMKSLLGLDLSAKAAR